MASPQATPKSYGTVLVAGGCGFLGSRLVDQLLNFPSEASESALTRFPSLRARFPPISRTGTTVHSVDLRNAAPQFDGCTYHEADITDADALLQVFHAVRPDVVINTVSPSWEAPHALLRRVNIEGTKTLLEVAGGARGDWGGQCKIFVHTSSASVVHDGDSDLINADERYPYVCPNRREYYSETKVHAEKLILAANDQAAYGHMLTCAVRPAGILGEGDRAGFSSGILKTPTVAHLQFGAGDNLFDNTYVHNVAYGLLCVTDALLVTHTRRRDGRAVELDHERVAGEAFNVTNDQPTYFWDSVKYLFTRYGLDVNTDKVWVVWSDVAYAIGAVGEFVNYLTGRGGKLSRQTVKYTYINRYYSCEKLKRRTAYEPIVPIEEGLDRSVAWYKEDEAARKESEAGKKTR